MNNNNKKLIYLLLGAFLALYIIYIRLILVRAPRELLIINPTFNYKLVFIITIGIITSLFLTYKNVNMILEKKQSNNIFQKFMIKINEIVYNSFNTLFNYILSTFVAEPYEICSHFAKKFYTFFSTITEGFLLYVNVTVRAIILIVFLIDVFYFFKFQYFYKVLTLLCVSLGISIALFILNKVTNNLQLIESFLIVNETTDPVTKESILEFSASPGNEDIDLDYTVEEYGLCSKMRQYLDIYTSLNDFYLPRFSIIMHIFYLFGWFYILIMNLFF